MRAPASGATAAPSPSPDPVTLSSSIDDGGCAVLGAERRGGVEKEEEARQPGLPRHRSPSLAHMAKVAAAALSQGHGTEVESTEKK
jgi:hypothetical protein